MEEQDAVNTPVETTTPTESAPVETGAEAPETADTQIAPADASIEPERKVSESVPYERFKKVNDRMDDPDFIARRAMELGIIPAPAPYQQEMTNTVPELDPESASAVRMLVAEERELERAAEFAERHAKDLENPFIRDRVRGLIVEANRGGRRMDQFKALEQAKQEFSQLVKPEVEQGVQEGQELGRKKLEASAVGTTTTPAEKVDDSQLSASEFAAKHGIPRDTTLIA